MAEGATDAGAGAMLSQLAASNMQSGAGGPGFTLEHKEGLAKEMGEDPLNWLSQYGLENTLPIFQEAALSGDIATDISKFEQSGLMKGIDAGILASAANMETSTVVQGAATPPPVTTALGTQASALGASKSEGR